MKKITWLLLSVFFFIFSNCSESKNGTESNSELDLLLEKANDFSKTRTERLKFISLAESKLLEITSNDSIIRDKYFKLAGRYYNIDDLENYLRISRKVYTLSINSKKAKDIARGLHYIGDYHFSKFKNDSAYYYFTKAEKKYDSLKLTKELIRVKFSKSDILLYEKDYSGAEVEIIKVLKIAKLLDDQRLVYDCLLNLGNTLIGLENIDEAIEYYNKALAITSNLKDDPQYISLNAQTNNFLGKAYLKKQDYVKAIECFDTGLSYSDLRIKDPYVYSFLLSNKAYAELKIGSYSTAQNKLEETLLLKEKNGNIPGVVTANLYLGELFILKKNYKKALFHLTKASQLASKNKILEDELKALKLMCKLDLPNKNLLYDKYIRLCDSVLLIERNKRDKFARIEYETDEIINEKKIIQEQKEQISSQRWLILSGSTGLILLLGLLYNSKAQYSKNKQLQFEREQQESNEQIYNLMLKQQTLINDVRQQEKKRISQELHDGVMSKLTSTRLNLFILSKKRDEETIKKCLNHIDKIQEIEKELRNISHDLNKQSLLEFEGFRLIITNLFEEYCDAIDIAYKIKIDKNINWDAIEGSCKMHLYRIFQECLQNIYKYSEATMVNLSIKKVLDRIIIDIEDNGKGFDKSKIKEGIGLKNMNVRARSINGEIKIYSAQSKGTHINLSMPY